MSSPLQVQGYLLWPAACGAFLQVAVPKLLRLKECNMQSILFPCTGWTGSGFSQDEEKSTLGQERSKQRSAEHPVRYLWHSMQNLILTAARHHWQRNKVLVWVTYSFSKDLKCSKATIQTKKLTVSSLHCIYQTTIP